MKKSRALALLLLVFASSAAIAQQTYVLPPTVIMR